jgi:SAM-dependent methyltransferase
MPFANLARTIVPKPMRQWLREKQRRYRLQRIRAGSVDFGQLRRLKPISSAFGFDRGLAIDRYYIEQFLTANASDIHGRVLEMGDDSYTRKFGGDRVQQADVLHVVEGNPRATIVGDLTCCDHIPSDIFDCIILTQTLQMIYDASAAVRHLHRILKPGGVLLLTAHGISKIARREGIDDWGEYWHFTAQSLGRMLKAEFSPPNVAISTFGNVLSALSYLHGLAAEELSGDELNFHDPDFEVLVTARAMKNR